MPRSYSHKRRNRIFSPSTKCIVLSKLVNCIMLKGKKLIAIKLLKKALDYIQYEIGVNPVRTLYEAVDNITPHVEVRTMKVGGVSYQIPIDVSSSRRLGLALRWLVSASRQRREANMWAKLAWEIIESALRRSASYKKKESVHALAKANQAFAHMGW